MGQTRDAVPALAATDCHDSPNPVSPFVQDCLIVASCAEASGFTGFAQALRNVAHDDLTADQKFRLQDNE